MKKTLRWCCAASVIFCAQPIWALTVVSTHSEDASLSLLNQFQQLNPNIKITILNRRVDLIPSGVNSGSLRNADVVLSSSPFLMQTLKHNGVLLTLPIGPVASQCAPKGLLLSDPEQKFASYGLSGFGVLWRQPNQPNQAARSNQPAPQSWRDVFAPALHRQLVMSTPSRSSSTQMMLEKVLQDEGWEQGWQTILRVGGQLGLIASRSFSVSEAIRSGDAAVSPMIDSHARSAMAANPDYRFAYFPSFAVMPSYVALLRGGEHQLEARLLVQYLFSAQGQKNLLSAPHFKVPLNANAEDKNSQMLCTQFRQQKPVNIEQLLAREQLLKQLYDQLITLHFEQLRDTWGLIHKAEAMPNLTSAQQKSLATARRLASSPPVSARQAADATYLAQFRQSNTAQSEIRRWQSVWLPQLAKAANLARRVLVNTPNEYPQ